MIHIYIYVYIPIIDTYLLFIVWARKINRKIQMKLREEDYPQEFLHRIQTRLRGFQWPLFICNLYSTICGVSWMLDSCEDVHLPPTHDRDTWLCSGLNTVSSDHWSIFDCLLPSLFTLIVTTHISIWEHSTALTQRSTISRENGEKCAFFNQSKSSSSICQMLM